MIAFPTTVGELKKFLHGFPDNMPIGSKQGAAEPFLDLLSVEWVCVRKADGTIIGSEAEDTETHLLSDQANALAFE